MQLSVVLAMGLALLPEMASANGGFLQSCTEAYTKDHYLIATCRKNGGGTRRTRQDLNLCVANRNNLLVPADNGKFFDSCKNCYIYKGRDNALMGCTCRTTWSTKWRNIPGIRLNNLVGNDDGYLWCFGHRSAPF